MLYIVMDADLSRFKTIVLVRPGLLWACSSGAKLKDFAITLGFLGWLTGRVTLRYDKVQGADSKCYKITWINFNAYPTSCPLNVLIMCIQLCTVCVGAADLAPSGV